MKRKSSHLLFGCFILLLLVPLYGLLVKQDFGADCENRVLAEELKFSLTKQFLDDFDVYVKDHLGYKNALTNLNASVKRRVFRSSSNPKNAVVGAKNWFFYTNKDDGALGSYTRSNLLAESELRNKMEAWEKWHDSLKTLGADLYFSVYPNKSTVYSENVPLNYKALQRDTISKIDQVKNYIQSTNSPLQLLDVRNQMTAHKEEHELYYRFDTHWNERGCFLGYQELCKKIGIEAYGLSDFNIEMELFEEGDLGRMSGLCVSPLKNEMVPRFSLKKQVNYGPQKTEEHGAYYWTNANPKLTKRILVFRDSYTNSMVKFLALHFKDGYYVATGFNYDVIQRLKPDIVVVATVERYFAR